jgi:8-amino-7-oxononanoate synthase
MPGPDDALRQLDAEGLRRRLRTLDAVDGPRVVRDGVALWNFAANDYLGLAHHPAVRDAFRDGLERFGHGAAASRLITGSHPPHAALESALAEAKGTGAALTFSSGFAAATGIIPALVGRDDFVVLDKLAHACLIDGAKLSGATLRVFPHNDTAKLARLLEKIRVGHPRARILVLTESVFSMDGDLCPLREIIELKDAHDALLLLDEAHGFGVLGPTGMGLAEALGLQSRVEFHMGTLGKAAGLAGAYLACAADWRELLVNRARSFVFSTAPPPALAHAAAAALALIRSPDGDHLRDALRANIERLRPGHQSPILPRVLGDNRAALDAADFLERRGFLVPAIRYPTVPRGTARLRVSLSAAHPPQALDDLAAALADLPSLTKSEV